MHYMQIVQSGLDLLREPSSSTSMVRPLREGVAGGGGVVVKAGPLRKITFLKFKEKTDDQ